MMSAAPLQADITQTFLSGSFVPLPDSCTAAKMSRDSITLSARERIVGGIVIPIAFSGLRLKEAQISWVA